MTNCEITKLSDFELHRLYDMLQEEVVKRNVALNIKLNEKYYKEKGVL